MTVRMTEELLLDPKASDYTYCTSLCELLENNIYILCLLAQVKIVSKARRTRSLSMNLLQTDSQVVKFDLIIV